jgi:hypothetical protein
MKKVLVWRILLMALKSNLMERLMCHNRSQSQYEVKIFNFEMGQRQKRDKKDKKLNFKLEVTH